MKPSDSLANEGEYALPVGMPRKRFLLAGILGLSILFYTIKQADLRKLVENVQDISLLWTPVVLLTSALSYVFIGAVLHRLLKSAGHTLPFATSFRISLISCTLNYAMTIGGLSGIAAKVYLLAKEKIPPSNTLSISMVHGFLTNTVAVIFIYLGFFFLYSEYKLSTREKEVGVIILLVAFLLSWITIQTIIHESFRKKLWKFCLRAVLFISRKIRRPHWVHNEKAQAFFEKFNENLNMIMKNPSILMAPAIYALLDWALMFFCLKCSFLAVRYPVDNWILLVGFSVGIFMTLFSITPASIGITEGSMAASFYLMGLDYDLALLGTLMYRFAYFFLPILISLFFYKQFIVSSPPEMKLKEGRAA